jgi:hypothetical protein
MKNLLSFVLVGASLFVVSAARAQEIRVKADIPFDFVAGNRAYPAGSYRIEPIENTTALLLEDANKSGLAMVMPHACQSVTPAESTKLVFHRVGDTYFLSQIWVEGRSTGREFAETKRETQLARNGENSQDIIVAANLTK